MMINPANYNEKINQIGTTKDNALTLSKLTPDAMEQAMANMAHFKGQFLGLDNLTPAAVEQAMVNMAHFKGQYLGLTNLTPEAVEKFFEHVQSSSDLRNKSIRFFGNRADEWNRRLWNIRLNCLSQQSAVASQSPSIISRQHGSSASSASQQSQAPRAAHTSFFLAHQSSPSETIQVEPNIPQNRHQLQARPYHYP